MKTRDRGERRCECTEERRESHKCEETEEGTVRQRRGSGALVTWWRTEGETDVGEGAAEEKVEVETVTPSQCASHHISQDERTNKDTECRGEGGGLQGSLKRKERKGR